MTKSIPWQTEEIELLKEVYPLQGLSDQLISMFPGRTPTSIRLKANRSGLTVLNDPRKGRSNEEYIDLLKGTNFQALEIYRGSTVPILHKCLVCGHEWNTRPQHVLKPGASCPICDLKNRTLSLDIVDQTLDLAGMQRLQKYTGQLDPVTLEHRDCGYIWTTKYSHIQQGSGCPVCHKGFGQKYHFQALPERATLYLIQVETDAELFLKVGVTVQPLKRRISGMLRGTLAGAKVEVINTVEGTGKDTLLKEAYLLNKYTRYHTQHKFEGHTEALCIVNNSISSIIKDMNENI